MEHGETSNDMSAERKGQTGVRNFNNAPIRDLLYQPQ
jgi:hypothetical protein